MPLHAFEAVTRGGRCGQTGDLRQMAGLAETQITGEAKFGIDLEDVRELREVAARVFIEWARDNIAEITRGEALAIALIAIIVAITSALGADIAIAPNLPGGVESGSRHHQYRIEDAIAFQAAIDHLLQSNAERKHGHERGDTHGDAERRKRIAQERLAEVLGGKLSQIADFHIRVSIFVCGRCSIRSMRPSASVTMRPA